MTGWSGLGVNATLSNNFIKEKSMKLKLLVFVLIMSLFSFGLHAQKIPSKLEGVTEVSTTQVKKWLDGGKDVFLLDTRNKSEFAAGHLPDAGNCPISGHQKYTKKEINQAEKALKRCRAISSLSKNSVIVTYCNSRTCLSSVKASLALVKMGYGNIHWMRDGISVWERKNFPVE